MLRCAGFVWRCGGLTPEGGGIDGGGGCVEPEGSCVGGRGAIPATTFSANLESLSATPTFAPLSVRRSAWIQSRHKCSALFIVFLPLMCFIASTPLKSIVNCSAMSSKSSSISAPLKSIVIANDAVSDHVDIPWPCRNPLVVRAFPVGEEFALSVSLVDTPVHPTPFSL